jgi:hypothetical protein
VVCRQRIVQACREDTVPRVEEPDHEEGANPSDGQLRYRTGLQHD